METKEYKAVPYGNGNYVFVGKSISGLETFVKTGEMGKDYIQEDDTYFKIEYQSYGCGIEGVPCVLLSDEEDVKPKPEMAMEDISNYLSRDPNGDAVSYSIGWKDGYKYKAAKAKGGYSEQQMRDAIAHGISMAKGETNIGRSEYIRSLKPKVQSICIEMEKQMCECAYEQEKDICIYPNCVKPATYTANGKTYIKFKRTYKQQS